MEQQCPARGTERQVAKFVEDHEIGVDETIGDLAGATLCLLLLERIDQLHGREEPDTLVVMLDRLNADRRCDMASRHESGESVRHLRTYQELRLA